MLKRSSQRRVATLLAAALACGVPGCTSPGSQRIVGPDGSAMSHVHCGAEQGTCFRIAGELCPSGYEMKPVLSGNDGNFLVRCRAPHPAAVAVAAAAPVCATPAPTNTPSVLMYPWPPPQSAAAAQRSITPAAPSAEIDLGY